MCLTVKCALYINAVSLCFMHLNENKQDDGTSIVKVK